ncbi:hypothetical protein AB0395_22145 [Streptosporangium sp. NPDC051023]|uniref:hypothetical protein n=1 Tax=Streptosporangium sp. NPDC051023 TaxID=3155410 RepID=UPI0034509B9F
MAPRRRHPILNQALAAAIAQAGWTHAVAAAAINRVAAENLLPLRHYGPSAIGHWLTGTIPQPEGACAAVEAFRRGLRRPDLTSADLGWPAAPADESADDPWQGDPVAKLTALGEDDMLSRRTALTAGMYSLAALALSGSPGPPVQRAGTPRRRAGATDVQRIEETTRYFSDLDDLYGGGHARTAVAAYLVHEVTPLLHDTTGRAHPALFSAASRLAYLAAYMAMDAGAHGIAQRYYVQASRLGAEAGSPALRATALRSMAVQALELGHAREGLDLADAAAAALGTCGPQRTQAWVTGMRAEAHAAVGDRRQALALLRRAEAELERADSVPEAEWIGNYRRESLEHQTGLALTALGEHSTAVSHYEASAFCRRPVERRTRVMIGARLAHAQLRDGQPDRAADTVLKLRDDLAAVSSARTRKTLVQVRRQWHPQRSVPAVMEADSLVAGVLRR